MKRSMFKVFTQNRPIFTFLFLALILSGIGVAGYGVYSYFDAENGIDNNLFHQTRESGEQIDIPNRPAMSSIALEYFESQQEYNDLIEQRGLAIRYIGIGLALVGAGWLGADFSHSRYKKQFMADDVSDAEPSAPESASEDMPV